jgi:CDP-6-deoxy-D-xylo-4-hexulose-3-dehydrase
MGKHLKISVGELRIDQTIRKAINQVLNSERISEGEKVKDFEEEWARYVGTRFSVTLNSGTSALIAGLGALRRNNKDPEKMKKSKVITTPISYVATSNAIVLNCFEPIYVDVDRDTFCITPENIRACLEQADNPEEYSLILPVHLMGYPCDMDGINEIAKENGLIVFEDSAQAHGTLYKGKKVGSLSALSAFSFYIAHNIQVGEMGAVTTNDYEIARTIRKLKANGRMCDCPICTRNTKGCPKMMLNQNDCDPRFTHEMIGYNFKTTEFQAALGLVQLERIDRTIELRRNNVRYLNEGLEKFSDLIQLPIYDKNVSYMAYPLVVRNPKKTSRGKIRRELERKGIETRPLFGCIPTQQPAYNHLRAKYEGALPSAEFVGLNGFYIGCHQYLTLEDLDYVISTFGVVLNGLLG